MLMLDVMCHSIPAFGNMWLSLLMPFFGPVNGMFRCSCYFVMYLVVCRRLECLVRTISVSRSLLSDIVERQQNQSMICELLFFHCSCRNAFVYFSVVMMSTPTTFQLICWVTCGSWVLTNRVMFSYFVLISRSVHGHLNYRVKV